MTALRTVTRRGDDCADVDIVECTCESVGYCSVASECASGESLE